MTDRVNRQPTRARQYYRTFIAKCATAYADAVSEMAGWFNRRGFMRLQAMRVLLRLRSKRSTNQPPKHETIPNCTAVQLVTAAVILFGVSMEWLFFATKPSFMSSLTTTNKLHLLLASPLPLIVATFSVNVLLMGLNRLFDQGSVRLFGIKFALGLASLMLAMILILMIDNFTYTMFAFGIKSLHVMGRVVYAVIFLILWVFCWRWIYRTASWLTTSTWRRWPVFLLAVFVATSGTVWLWAIHGISESNGFARANAVVLKHKPNILLIATDGVNADHMSVYGYERATTPFIEKFIGRGSLFCENAFSNAGNTGGSVTSLLSGKLPTQTRVYYPPDILQGRNSFEHLPGILHRYGYRNVDISIRHYADAYDMNMKNGFDYANGRKTLILGDEWWQESEVVQNTLYFLSLWLERIKARLLYIFGLASRVDYFDEVVGRVLNGKIHISDTKRMKQFYSFVDNTTGPFFAHIHLMGTHGPKFYPTNHVFSSGHEQNKNWMLDFYDDAILDFDHYFEEAVHFLESRHRLANTLFVIQSDHGMLYRTDRRIPLIFIFPHREYSRHVSVNTQLTDVAPTILDYLGIPIPNWMHGVSLLTKDPDRLRPIISVSTGSTREKNGLWVVDNSKVKPPYYDLARISILICDQIHIVDLYNHHIFVERIPGHTDPCSAKQLPSTAAIFEKLNKHLQATGYPPASLDKWPVSAVSS